MDSPKLNRSQNNDEDSKNCTLDGLDKEVVAPGCGVDYVSISREDRPVDQRPCEVCYFLSLSEEVSIRIFKSSLELLKPKET